MLAKRGVEKELEALRARQAWQQAAAGLALALMSGAGISAWQVPPAGIRHAMWVMST